jgi:NADH-quinone oxidoreductase subunit A
VAILFILFDLEVMFLIPFSISLNILTNFGLGLGLFFFFVLAIGILYEWRYKALNWAVSKH